MSDRRLRLNGALSPRSTPAKNRSSPTSITRPPLIDSSRVTSPGVGWLSRAAPRSDRVILDDPALPKVAIEAAILLPRILGERGNVRRLTSRVT